MALDKMNSTVERQNTNSEFRIQEFFPSAQVKTPQPENVLQSYNQGWVKLVTLFTNTPKVAACFSRRTTLVTLPTKLKAKATIPASEVTDFKNRTPKRPHKSS